MGDIIGIIDRGVGGLGLYQKLRQKSNHPVLYFADNCNQPYGLIEAAELKKRLDDIILILKKHGATKIVLACNSASVVYPDTDDVKGIIQFGVNALTNIQAKNLGLIATLGTVKSGIYTHHFKALNIEVKERIAQPFAIHIENGTVDGDVLEYDAKLIMQPLQNCDAILMACTHFPAITSLLQRHVKSDCQLIDPVDGLLQWLEEYWLNDHQYHPEQSKFLVTGSASNFMHSAKNTYDIDIPLESISRINMPL